MFWLPRKTIYTGPKKQRGNIVFTTGLPPTQIVDPAGNYFPSGAPSPGGAWTVEQDWQYTSGDLTYIYDTFIAFGGRPRAGCIAWSLDGTKLTLQSTSSDNTLTFLVATPFDPNTAFQVVFFSVGVLNETWGMFNASGTRWVSMGSTDTYRMYNASAFVPSNSGAPIVLSDVSKTEVGFTSSTDGAAVWGPTFDYMLWMGGQTSDAIKNISTPGGNLDAWVEEELYYNGTIDPNNSPPSNLDKSETMFFQGAGSQGVTICSFNSPREVSSWNRSAAYDIRLLGSFDFRPGGSWFDPNDTRYVWMIADPTSNLQIVKYATHVPESL